MQLNLLKFTISITSALVNVGTVQRSIVGHPSKHKSNSKDIQKSVKRKSVAQEPVKDEGMIILLIGQSITNQRINVVIAKQELDVYIARNAFYVYA